jgi:hypothetical protein
VKELLAGEPQPTIEDINAAFWQACHGGQRRMAAYLLGCGADINAIPGFSDNTPLDIAESIDTRRDTMTTWLREQGATSAKSQPDRPDER